MSSELNRSASRRHRASFLALAVIAVVAAGVLPACLDSGCCPLTGERTVQSQMPCCEPTIAPRDLSLRPVTSAGSVLLPQTWAPVAVVEPPGASPSIPPRVQATLATASRAHQQPPPTLFLLNAQLLLWFTASPSASCRPVARVCLRERRPRGRRHPGPLRNQM